MKQDFLLQAIGQIDDDLIMDAEQGDKRPIPLRRQIGAWAAALLVCVGVGSAFALWSTDSGASSSAPESAVLAPMAPMAPQLPVKPVPSAPGALADTAAPAETVVPSETVAPIPPVDPGAAANPVVPVVPGASATPVVPVAPPSSAPPSTPFAPDVTPGSGPSASAWNGPLITTQERAYLLQTVQAESLPSDCRALGSLSLAAPGGTVYPVTLDAEYVGCPVWVSADGMILYLQLADGRLLCGIPAQ